MNKTSFCLGFTVLLLAASTGAAFYERHRALVAESKVAVLQARVEMPLPTMKTAAKYLNSLPRMPQFLINLSAPDMARTLDLMVSLQDDTQCGAHGRDVEMTKGR